MPQPSNSRESVNPSDYLQQLAVPAEVEQRQECAGCFLPLCNHAATMLLAAVTFCPCCCCCCYKQAVNVASVNPTGGQQSTQSAAITVAFTVLC